MSTPQHPPPTRSTAAHDLRLSCRAGTHTTPTTRLASTHLQANILILPRTYALDFQRLCARNPVPCPLLGYTPIKVPQSSTDPQQAYSTLHPAQPNLPPLVRTSDFDIRTDLPRYNIYQSGLLLRTQTDVLAEWTTDHVAFAIGCSFSFEFALDKAGLPPRHWQTCSNVPMYRTKHALNPAGVFTGGTYVVSMRPYREEDLEKVRNVTAPYGGTHGEPIAWGWDAVEELGIVDLGQPEFGDGVEVGEGEVPVFWGCGVTPQVAVMEAGAKIQGMVMAHTPGHMLVLDITEDELLRAQEY